MLLRLHHALWTTLPRYFHLTFEFDILLDAALEFSHWGNCCFDPQLDIADILLAKQCTVVSGSKTDRLMQKMFQLTLSSSIRYHSDRKISKEQAIFIFLSTVNNLLW